MTVTVNPTLTGDLAKDAWKLYETAFTPLATRAVQRHVMYRSEFDDVAADPRIDKVLTHDDTGELVGVATFTRDLDAVPLISPAYFQHRWPQLYAERRIWYIGLVAVAEHARKTGAFVEAFRHYYDTAAAVDGIIGLDVCAYNEETFHLPTTIGLQVRRLSGGESLFECADSQRYWIYDVRGKNLQGSHQ